MDRANALKRTPTLTQFTRALRFTHWTHSTMTDRTTNGCSSNNRIHVRGRVSDGGSATARLALCQLNCQSRAGGKQLGAADAWVGAPSWKRWAAPRTGCASRGPAHRAATAPWRARGGVAAVRPAAPSLGIFGRVCEPSSRTACSRSSQMHTG